MRQPLSHGAVAHCSAGAWKSQFWMMKLVRLNQPQQSKMVCPLKLELFCTVRQLVRRKSVPVELMTTFLMYLLS